MIDAWHFVGETLRDGRPIPADGVWLEHTGPLRLCEEGLHASRRAIDALSYAPGSVVCRVEIDGEIIEGDDKLVASRRRIVWRADVADEMRAFARGEALAVAHLWDVPPIVREYLETGADSIRDAAWAAAWDATRDAARAAALDAARAATWDAARAAARDATWAAARAADRDAARDTARAAALDAVWDAARAAARAAALDAALDAANERLTAVLLSRAPT